MKKIKLLYGLIIVLLLLIIGMFFYYQAKLRKYDEYLEVNSKVWINVNKRINEIVELNYLDTSGFTYIINSTNWNEELKDQIGMNIDIPDNCQLDSVIIRRMNDKEVDDVDQFIIVLKKLDGFSFKDFANSLYQKIHHIFGEVDSFNDKDKYYEISSFEEASYNNMYYDYMKTLADGSTGGPKVKIKILEDEKQVRIEVNKF